MVNYWVLDAILKWNVQSSATVDFNFNSAALNKKLQSQSSTVWNQFIVKFRFWRLQLRVPFVNETLNRSFISDQKDCPSSGCYHGNIYAPVAYSITSDVWKYYNTFNFFDLMFQLDEGSLWHQPTQEPPVWI